MTRATKTAPSESRNSVVENIPALSAENLKGALWETLHAIKAGAMLPGQGDAIASQAREILRTVKIQLQIAGQSKRRVPGDVVDFAEQQLIGGDPP